MNLPTVKQLRYFVALCDLEHFGRAAEACFVSQSAFSTAIRELETTLDVQVVDRTNKRVAITPVGREIAVQARLVLRDLTALVEHAQQSTRPLSGPLQLGVIPTIAPFLLPKVLPGIRKKFPELQLFLREDQSRELHEKLLDGELDLVLLALPYPMRGVELMPLFDDPFLLACRNNTQRVDPNNYRFNRLQAESVLLLEDGHCLRDHALSACKIRNLEKVSRFAATSLLTLIEMVDNDLGITFLPAMAQHSHMLKNTRVKTYPLKEKSTRSIALVWRKGSGREEEFRLLGETFQSLYL